MFLPREILGQQFELLIRVPLRMLVHDCGWTRASFELLQDRCDVGSLQAGNGGDPTGAIAVRSVTASTVCREAARCLVLTFCSFGGRCTKDRQRNQKHLLNRFHRASVN